MNTGTGEREQESAAASGKTDSPPAVIRERATIRGKLLRLTWQVLFSATLSIVATGVVLGIKDYNTRVTETRDNVYRKLLAKGNLLVANNSIALKTMALDNAFTDIGNLVASTVEEGGDVAYGIYMDAERRAWAWRDSRDSSGADMSAGVLEDSAALWAAELKNRDHRPMLVDGREIIEFAAPVMDEDQRLGTIRYALTTDELNAILAETGARMFRYSIVGILFLVGAGLLVMVFWGREARRRADAIAAPLVELRKSAESISGGDYQTEVRVTSDDEIGVLAEAFEIMRRTVKEYTDTLEEKVALRTRQLEEAQKELLAHAHQAGMADIASSVLHNVGNILTSVITSGNILQETLENSHLQRYRKANELLRSHLDDLAAFLSGDPKGRQLVQYYLSLENAFSQEQGTMLENVNRLTEKVNAIREVVAAQQSFASGKGLEEIVDVNDAVKTALKIQEDSDFRHSITVIRDLAKVPRIPIQKAKVIHIVVNLMKNAKESIVEQDPLLREIIVRTFVESGKVIVSVRDSGKGVAPEALTRIFSHGFTTKPDGHGFGLHSCANYMGEMGGTIRCDSEGEGKGACFLLEFPLPTSTPALA